MNTKITKQNNVYNSLIIFYVISMMFAFTTRYGDILLGFKLQIIIGLMWILLAFYKYALNGYKIKSVHNAELPRFLKLYMFPHIVIHLYTVILIVIGKVNINYLTSNLTVYIPTIFVIAAIYLLGTEVYKYTCISLILSWFLSVSASFAAKGPLIFVHAIRQAYFNPLDNTGGLNINYLELHDIVLASGYILVYNIYRQSRISKKQYLSVISILIIMTLGMKRIAVLGVIIAWVYYIIISRFTHKLRYKFSIRTGWLAFVLCYLFIYLISRSDLFYEIINKYDINVMSRNYYYNAIMNFAEFNPKFIGIGRNVTTQLFNTDLSYLRVGGVHSDIIKMYVENGFILFGLWLWYFLIKITKFYEKLYGIESAVLYFGITIYTFILYLTDNVEVYFICQIFAMIIPITNALNSSEKLPGKNI